MGIWQFILILFYPLVVLMVLKEFNADTEKKIDEKNARIKELEFENDTLTYKLNGYVRSETGKNGNEKGV